MRHGLKRSMSCEDLHSLDPTPRCPSCSTTTTRSVTPETGGRGSHNRHHHPSHHHDHSTLLKTSKTTPHLASRYRSSRQFSSSGSLKARRLYHRSSSSSSSTSDSEYPSPRQNEIYAPPSPKLSPATFALEQALRKNADTPQNFNHSMMSRSSSGSSTSSGFFSETTAAQSILDNYAVSPGDFFCGNNPLLLQNPLLIAPSEINRASVIDAIDEATKAVSDLLV